MRLRPSPARGVAGASEALLHAPRGHEEGPRHLRGREPDGGREGEGRGLTRFERGVAAREEEPEELVLPPAGEAELTHRGARPRAHLREGGERAFMAGGHGAAARAVAVTVECHRDQPRFGDVRDAVSRPHVERARHRVVEGVLRVGQRASGGVKLREGPGVGAPEEVGGALGHAPKRHVTGRTSTAWRSSQRRRARSSASPSFAQSSR